MPILFSDLCLLFDRIAHLNTPSHGNANTSRISSQTPAQINANDILISWLAALENTTHLDGLRLYRLIFPEHDIRRRYGLKETLLARELPQALGFISPPYLSDWKAEHVETISNASRHGCFGLSLCQALQFRNTVHSESIELTQLDLLLDELASHCEFSSIDLKTNYSPTHRRPREIILNDLFRSLNAKEAAYLAQIILRDLSPLLYPVPSFISENALVKYNSSSYQPLELLPALSAWNWALPTIYKYRSDLDACFAAINAKQVLKSMQPFNLLEKLCTD
jgi:DNA ligase-4